MINAVGEADDAGQGGGQIEGVVAEAEKKTGPEGAAGKEGEQQGGPEPEAAPVDGQAAQQMSKENAKVGEDTGDVRGAQDGAAVGADHGILEATGAGSQVITNGVMAAQER